MKRSEDHIAHGGTEPTAQKRQAVLLFARTPLNEARSKRIRGLEIAARLKLFAALTHHAIAGAHGSGADLVVAADADVPVFRENAAHLLLQRGNNFGERLLNALRDTFALGYDQVAVIGNDSPELSGEKIRRILNERPSDSLTLCRAADGGATLIALDRRLFNSLPSLFARLRWETSFLFDDLTTAACAQKIAIDVWEGESDLDTLHDLLRFAGCAAAPHALRELASRLLPVRSSRPSISYVRPLRRTLRVCRQKAPPASQTLQAL